MKFFQISQFGSFQKTQPTQEEFRHHKTDFFKIRFEAQNDPKTLLKLE